MNVAIDWGGGTCCDENSKCIISYRVLESDYESFRWWNAQPEKIIVVVHATSSQTAVTIGYHTLTHRRIRPMVITKRTIFFSFFSFFFSLYLFFWLVCSLARSFIRSLALINSISTHQSQYPQERLQTKEWTNKLTTTKMKIQQQQKNRNENHFFVFLVVINFNKQCGSHRIVCSRYQI